ncbi:filamentous hemagglutinin N-terminal domain-containing protein [Microbulbifer sp. ZKSA004]|uniref:filamentous hemagglutinin N-terminal domain-containing protein n=1 Tax=Microbulbifer sp. ZKSA004 TaxID=3243389 RepID=UPI004039A1CE
MKAKNKKLELRKLASAIKVSSFAYAGLFAGLISPMVHAGPEGGVVTGGSGTIDVDGTTTTVDQVTDLLSIDWESFNLSEEELVKFLQPDSSSIVLNRILDQDVTTIQGAIEANGHVILVNPRGVLFTETATVNVGAITASGLDMSPEDFMNGDFAFKGESGSSGVVVNRGVINASSAVLVGKQVTNASSGLISAELVSLAAADEALLTFDADGMIGIKVTKEVMENDLGLDSAALNEGAIEGAQVLMEASVSGDLFTAAVNNEGTITAHGIDTSGGKIRLFGSGSGVVNSGTLDASGSIGGEVVLDGDFAEHSGYISVAAHSGSGGAVNVLGDEVVVSGNVDARGTSSGGEVLVGGDYQGDNEDIRNAKTTTVTAEATIDASGVGDTDGGTVIVWADETTNFGGTILAESGADGGDGGLVETSGKIYLNLDEDNMFVSTLSHGDGETGLWLLDPDSMEISAGCDINASNCVSTGAIESALNNSDVTIKVTGANSGDVNDDALEPEDGDSFSEGILVSSALSWGTDNSLILQSYTDVEIASTGSISSSNADATLFIDAGGSFTNAGSINVYNFELSVGVNPFDSDDINESSNTLGDLTVLQAGTITGHSDADTFIFSDADDNIILSGDNAFTFGNISFSEIEQVNLGGGENSISAGGISDAIAELTGNNKETTISSIAFSNVNELSDADLKGTSGTDSFELNADGTVTVYGMTASGVSVVDGNGDAAEQDSLDASAYSAGVALTGSDNQVTADSGDLSFLNMHEVVVSTLTGTTGTDEFTVTGTNTLSAAEIDFSGVSSVVADLGTDTAVGADGIDWNLAGTNNQAENSGITFSGIDAITVTNANLVGTTDTDNFTLNADGTVKAYEITAAGMSAVDGNGDAAEQDSLNASAYSAGVALTGSDNQVTADSGDLSFLNMHEVVVSTLTGTTGTDEFTVTGTNALSVAEIDFSGVSSVVADLGTDTAVGADGIDWNLAGTNNQAENSGITFSGIDAITVTNANLVGTTDTDSFTLNADGTVKAYEITAAGMSAVDGNGDAAEQDSLDASAYSAGVALTGSDNQVTADSGDLSFLNMHEVVVSTLTGTTGTDEFTVTGTNTLSAAEIDFSGVSSVVADLGTDTAVGADGIDWNLAGTNNQAENSGITFSGIDAITVTNANLVGTTDTDNFTLNADGTVKAYEITAAGMSAVDGNGDAAEQDSLDASAYSAGVALTGSDNQVTADSGDLSFLNMHEVVVSTLTGTTGTDEFTVTGTNTLSAAEIDFSGVSSVVADLGTDTAVGADGIDWNLAGTNNQAENSGITFSGIDAITVTNANLVGTTDTDSFTLNADGTVKAYEITAAGMSAVDGNGDTAEQDSLDASAYSAGVALTGSDNQVTADSGDLSFLNMHEVVVSTLTGTTGTDEFTVTGTNALSAVEIDFSGVSSVVADLGTDTAVGADGIDWNLAGTNNQAENSGITFSGIDAITVTNANLVGTTDTDNFTLNADGTVKAYEITAAGMSAVDGNGDAAEQDSLNASAYSAGVALTGSDNQVTADSGDLSFLNMHEVVVSTLTGTTGTDEFTVTGTNALSVAEIDFSGVSSVVADLGTDTAVGADGIDWNLAGTNNQAENSGITFSGIDAITVTNANLVGTTDTDSFTLNADGTVKAYEITAAGMSAVDGNGDAAEQDSLDASAYSAGVALTGSDNQVTADSGDLSFLNMNEVVVSTLTGTTGTDEFTVTGTNALSVAEIDFSGVSSVVADLGTDTAVGADGADWTLTGANYKAESSGITFSTIENIIAVNAGLIGSADPDTFVVASDGTITANAIDVSGFSGNIDAKGGADSVTGADGFNWELTGTDYEATNNSITFNNVETLTASSANLTGTNSADAFALLSSGNVEAYSMTVSGMTAVNGNGGSDSLDASGYSAGLALTGNNNQVTAESGALTFNGIFSAVTAALVGSSDADSFTVDGTNAATSYDIAFTGLSTVDAADGSDSVIGADGADWTLTGTDNKAINSGITFSDVSTLTTVNANLVGTTNADAYVLQSDGDVEVDFMTVSGMTAVNGNGGSDSLDASGYSAGLALTGSNNQVTAESGALTFNGIFSAVTGALVGSSDADSFTVDGTNAATSYDIAFTGLSTVDAADGSDSVIGADGADWTLTGTDNKAINSGITFSDVSTLTTVNANLVGTTNADAYVLQSNGDVEVDSMTVSGMTAVNGNSNNDTLDASGYSAGLALTGSNNQVTAESGALTFNGITSAITAALTGTSGADSFTVDGDNAVTSYNIGFTGLSTVDAADGSDSITALGVVTLTGTDNQVSTASILFSGIDSVSGGSLEASTDNDSFEVTGWEALTANKIAFSSISSVDAADGTDSAIGADGVDWELTGTAYEATNNGITFSNIETLTASNANLTGTDSADAFVLLSSGNVEAYSMTVSGMTAVNGGDGNDTLDASSYSDGLVLTGANHEVTAQSGALTFTGIVSAVTSALEGTSDADSFIVDGTNAATSYNIAFTGLSTIDALGGEDSVTGADGADWTLTGANYKAESSGITFSTIENIIAVNAGLIGSADPDTFVVASDGTITANAIDVSGFSGNIDAKGGADSVTGADGFNWELTGTDYEATNNSITFNNVETLTASSANLTGTNSADAFALLSSGNVEAYSMTVSGMTAVNGNGGSDSLDASGYSAGLALTGSNNQVTAESGALTFNGIFSAVTGALVGSSGADSFTVDGTNAATSYDIAFTGLSTVDAADGSDSVIGADGADWTLTGTDNEAINSSITFSDVSTLTTVNANLVGTTSADAYVLQSDGDVEAYSMTVSGMTAVNGNGGSDSLDASGYSVGLALTGSNNQVTAESGALTFNGIFSAVTGALVGSSDADSFAVDGTNAATSYDIAFTGLSTVDAADGSDSVIGADGADWTLTGTDNEAINSSITFSDVSTLTTVNANLVGTTNADAYVLQSNGDVEVDSMTVSGMTAVNGNSNNDTLDASGYSAGLALTGSNNQVTAESGALTFNGITSAITAALTGTSGADSFTVDGDNAVTSYNIGFTGLSTVDAADGSDSITALGVVTLTGTDNQVSTASILFSGIDSVSGGSLEASTDNDSFEVTGWEALTANKIAFSSISSVDAADGTDSAIGADGVDWELTGTAYEATNNGITFSNIETLTASNANLTGTDSADAFVLLSSGNVEAYSMTVSGMTAVNGGDGNDTLDASSYSDGLVLTGANHEVTAQSGALTFTGIVSAVTSALEGTSDADSFIVDGTNAATSYNIAFTGLSTIDALGGEDSVTGADGADWTLTGANYKAESSGITFSTIENIIAVNAGLIGSADPDTFVVASDGTITANAIDVSGFSGNIDAKGGADSVTGADGFNWELTGTDYEATNNSITFNNVETLTASSANLTGTNSADAFALLSSGNVEAYSMTVSGMTAVNGNGGSDSLDASGYSAGLALTGNNNQVTAESGALTFNGIFSAVTAALVGSSDADSFTVDGTNAATSYDIAFTGLSTVDAADGSDSVIGADGADWTLTGTDNKAINSGITFSDVSTLTTVNANLVGTTNADAYVLQSNGDVEVDFMTVSGMTAVNGNGGSDSLDASGYSAGLALTGSNNQVTAESGALTFNGIFSAVTAALVGSSDADSFTVDGTNAATSYDIAFTGLSTVDAADGSDSVIGADGADWTLTGTDNKAINSSITFSDVSTLTTVNANLVGTTNADAYVLQSDGDVEVDFMTVSGMTAVNGNGGSDSLDASGYSAGLALTGNNNQVTAESGALTFNGIFSAVTAALVGSSDADSFTVDGTNAATSYDIAFTGLSTVNAADGSDSVIGADGADWTLTGTDNEAINSSITFSDVSTLTTVNANLVGTTNADAYVLQSDGDVEAYSMTVSGMTAVNGNGGSDSLDASGYSAGLALTGSNNQVTAESGALTFNGITSAITAALTGTSGADSFIVDGTNAATSYDIAFTGLSTVDAADGSDSVIGADGADWTLTGTDNEAINSSITFSDVSTLTTVNANLVGTTNADAYVLQSDGDVEVDFMTVSGMTAVNGNGGSDSLDASGYSAGLALTGNNNQVTAESGALTFNGIFSAVTAALVGSSDADSFTVDGTNAATSYDIAFTGLSTVDAADGSDSVIGADGADWTLTGTDNEAINSSITFSDVSTLTTVNANLVGTTNADAYVLQSDGDVEVDFMTVSGMTAVNGNGGSDSLDASGYSAGLALTGSNNQVTAESGVLTFNGIFSAVTAALVGSSDADSFTVDGTNAATSYDIAFTGLSTVDAADGSDSVIGADGADWTLTGTDNEAINSSITFSDVSTLTTVNANLVGTTNADAYVLKSDGDVEVDFMTVSGMTAVNGNSNNDTLDASGYSAGLALTGSNNQVTAESGALTFNGIFSAVTGALVGSSGADSFTVDGTNAATSYDIAFTGLSTVDAADGSDSVIGADGADWTLTGTDNEAINSSITFSDVSTLTTVNANLVGTTSADAYVLQSDGDVEAYSMTVSGMTAVNGNGGSDSLDASGYSVGLALTGSNNQVTAESGALTFNGIFSAVTGALVGSSDADSFAVDGTNAATSYDIAFTGLSTVDAADGSDSVIGADGADWTLTGTDNEAINSSITFSDVSTLTTVNANLVGTTNADAYVLQSNGDVEVDSMTVSGMTAVNGNSNNDTLDASGYSAGLALTGSNNQVTAESGALTFNGITSAITAALTGTSGADSFTVDGDNAVTSYNIGFTGLSTVDAADGSDSITALGVVTLTGTDNQVSTASILFSGIDSVSGGSLEASTDNDSFEVTGWEALTANKIAFSSISSVDAADGTDSAIGADGVDWELTGTAYEATNNGITFSNIETLTASNANLTGTDSADAFVLLSSGNVEAYSMTVSGMTAVNGGDGNDTLDASSYSDGLVLTGANHEVTAQSGALTFTGIVSAVTSALEGTSDADSFIVDGTNAATSYDIAFTGLSTVDAADGSDSVIGADGADWTLTGTDNEAINSSITFSDVSTLTTVNANLVGTTNADAYVLQSDGDVEVDFMTVSGMTAVNGNGGSDNLDASGYSAGLALTGSNNQVTAESGALTFNGIFSAVTAALVGSSDADSFTVDGTNAATSYDIAFTGLSTVDAADGSDSVIGADGADWTLTGTDNKAINSSITFSDVSTLTTVNANLVGTTNADAYVLQSDGDVEVDFMTVSGMTAVNGNGGSDSLDASGYSAGLALTGSNNQVTAESGALTFNGVFSAVTAALVGSSDADSFTVDGTNAATSYDIAFTGLSTVNAADGSDSVIGADGADWTLTGTDNEAINSSITFSDVSTLTTVNANLVGTTNADAYVLQSDGDVEAYSMTVSGMTAVNGNGGSDSLDASGYSAGLALTGSNNQVTAESGALTFNGITSAITAALTGTSGADSFIVDGTNAATSYDIAFTGLSTVDAADGSDSVIGADGADWTLTGTDNEAINSSITFSDVSTLTTVNANLVGTTNADAYVLQSDGDVEVDFMTVSGMTAVNGNGGSDSLDASGYSAGLALTGSNNQVTAESGALTFNGVFSAVTAALVGSSDADSFTVDGTNAATSYDIAFTGLSTVNAADGSDSVIGADGADWTLTGTDNEAINSSITFSDVSTLTTVNANLVGTTNADAYVLQSDGDVEAYSMTVSGMTAVNGNGGSDSLDASGYSAGLALTGNNNQVTAESGALTFNGIFSAVTAALVGSSDADSFTVDGTNAATSYDIAFTGLSTVDADDGSDSVIGADGADWTLTGTDNEAINSSITFSDVSTLTTVNANLVGTTNADAYVLQSDGDVEAYSMTVSGMTAVNGNGGSDSLDASGYSAGLALTGSNNQVTAESGALTFNGIFSAVTGALVGSSGADSFTVDGTNAATSYDIAFTGLSTVDAADGSDSVIGADGADWTLTGTDNEAINSSITFSDVSTLTTVNANLVGTTSADAYVLQSDGDVEAYSMTVSGMTAVNGNGGSDSLDASAYSGGLALTGIDNQLLAGSLAFDSISSAITETLTNTYDSALFELQGSQALDTAGISFTGLESVNTSGSSSLLLGTDGDDSFRLSSNGDISVAGIDFSGLETIDGAEGSDTVSADGAAWTSTSSGGSLVDGSVEAEINSLTVFFENLELVEGAGSYVGQNLDGEYVFSALDIMEIGGVTFADLNSITAGSGTDVVYGANIDTDWDINDSGNTVTSDGESITITGIESIMAGGGSDQFALSGGALTEIDSGAGDDVVILSGTVIDIISLGAGNDYVQVDVEASQDVNLSGGDGNDDFQYNLAGDTWEIYSSGNQVGSFRFNGFEYLDNTADSITVDTDLAFNFENGGNTSENFNKNGAGIQFSTSGMRLGYDGEGDIYITSSTTETIGGSLAANRAELVVSGDVDIETEVGTLALATSGADIDVSVMAAGDLVIDEINSGRGTVSLASSNFGVLTAETYGDTHITASAVTLGSETHLWTIIGDTTNPLRVDITDTLDIYSVSYYEPEYIGQIPTVTSTGDELESVAGAQASQGLKSAVQSAVEDFTQVDPAIFSAVKPYSSGIDAVNSPEMRLKAGELKPTVTSAAEGTEVDTAFDAELEVGTSDLSDEGVGDMGSLTDSNAGG